MSRWRLACPSHVKGASSTLDAPKTGRSWLPARSKCYSNPKNVIYLDVPSYQTKVGKRSDGGLGRKLHRAPRKRKRRWRLLWHRKLYLFKLPKQVVVVAARSLIPLIANVDRIHPQTNNVHVFNLRPRLTFQYSCNLFFSFIYLSGCERICKIEST